MKKLLKFHFITWKERRSLLNFVDQVYDIDEGEDEEEEEDAVEGKEIDFERFMWSIWLLSVFYWMIECKS